MICLRFFAQLYCTNCEAWQLKLTQSIRHCKFLECQVARLEHGPRGYEVAEAEPEAEEGGAMMYERSPTPLEEEEDRQQQAMPEEEMEAKYGQEQEPEPELEQAPPEGSQRWQCRPGAPLSVVEEGSQEDGSEEQHDFDQEMKQAEEAEHENVVGEVSP